jgi:hypothetical protein
VLNCECSVREFKRRMRTVPGKNLKGPESAASRNKEKKDEKNETNDPAAHGDLTLCKDIRMEWTGGSSHNDKFDGPGLGQ